ncbi:hypothetical protein TWF788_005249 [Orbilia oligospora]|uniref:Uncharacterized protein n=1 Tax=Orbilia oligospora TaxID=2813651 RepID=A0A7C8PYY2_ORBOL|nr:hypothetical protein TWF788_005249 [Orbilia oligospora]
MKFFLPCILVLSAAAALPTEKVKPEPKKAEAHPDPRPNVQVALLGQTCDLTKHIYCAPGLSCFLIAQQTGTDKNSHQGICIDVAKEVNNRQHPEFVDDLLRDTIGWSPNRSKKGSSTDTNIPAGRR